MSGAVRAFVILLTALAGLLAMPEPAWAWGPGTHIFLGGEVLGALSLLPAGVAALLRRNPLDFLYGCVAADITFGKKYAPVGRHCHYWHIGEELYEAAECDATRACALGYLTHLAADTIAHNFFLPRRLLTSASTQSIGHSYWEHRMDAHLGERYVQAARRLVVEFDHSHNDTLFDEVLDRTVFSFQTNRRIFRGIIRLAGHETWQAFFDRVIDLSRWDMNEAEVETWVGHSFDYTVDYIVRRDRSIAARLDPTGEENLEEARRLRRETNGKTNGAPDLERLARQHFALPLEKPRWWNRRLQAHGIPIPPILPPIRDRDLLIQRFPSSPDGVGSGALIRGGPGWH